MMSDIRYGFENLSQTNFFVIFFFFLAIKFDFKNDDFKAKNYELAVAL